MFQFALIFGDKRIASSPSGPGLSMDLSGFDWGSCGAQGSIYRWPLAEMVSASAAVSPDVLGSGTVP